MHEWFEDLISYANVVQNALTLLNLDQKPQGGTNLWNACGRHPANIANPNSNKLWQVADVVNA